MNVAVTGDPKAAYTSPENSLNSSAELERLLSEVIMPSSFDASALPCAFRSVVRVLVSAGVLYAVTGRVALARYCRAQCEHVITLRLDESVGAGIAVDLRETVAAVLSPNSSVRLEIGLATSVLERRFLELASPTPWFGIDAAIACPEHLLWFCLASKSQDAFVDAIHLCQTPQVDWAKFEAIVGPHNLKMVERSRGVRKRAEREVRSTFSAMMEHRMADLKQRERQPGYVAPVPVYRLNEKNPS